MSAHQKIDQNQRLRSRRITHLLLLLIFLWAFLGTIDGPALHIGTAAGSVVCKTAHVLARGHGVQPGPLCIGEFPDDPLPVHASFLLFDFKQNLRQWPNVSGDISRSPPFLRSLQASFF